MVLDNQGNTLVETPDNPASNVGAGSEFTEENLEANILAAIDSPSGVSTGVVETPAATDVPGEPAAAPETKVEETKPAEAVDDATVQRLRQDLATQKATLVKLGIDPDGDTAENLRSGLITVEELISARAADMPATTPEIASPTTPQIPLDQKIVNLQNRLGRKGQVTDAEYKEDMSAALEVIRDVVTANQNISQTMQNNDLNNLLEATVSTTKEVFNTDVKSVVPEDVRAIGEELFVGATDVGAGNYARSLLQRGYKDGKERAFSPKGYRAVAKDLATRYDTFVQAIFKAGQVAAVKAINEANPSVNTATVVNPIAPGGGGGTPPPPPEPNKFTINNLDANVDEYFAGTQPQV